MAMAKNVAPQKRGSSTFSETFAANYATTDLTTRSGKPAFAAQLVDFKNSGTSNQDAVFTTQAGTVMTVTLNPGQVYPSEVPIETITDTSGADVSAIAYWYYADSGMPINA